MDRTVIAAAPELADLGVRANVIKPGPIDTGWMTELIRALGVADTPAGGLGTPEDTAHLVRLAVLTRPVPGLARTGQSGSVDIIVVTSACAVERNRGRGA